ncbi:MAG: packaged DNA stabilization protein [Citromicrobium sp.]
MGTEPVEALFKGDLVLTGALYGVAGNLLYRDGSSLGGVSISGHVSMAGNEIGLMIAGGDSLYFYNGSTIAAVSFPDGADVIHVTSGGSRFWFVRKDTGKLYWTNSLDSDVGALNFLTAESLPDRLLQTLWIDGGLIAFGSESIEFYRQTGNATLPLAPIQNLVIEKGIKATGTACVFGETFACVTNQNQVIVQSERNVVSNVGLEARIAASSVCKLFPFEIGGQDCLALRLDGETQVYNRRTGLWSEFTSYGQSNWLPQCYAGGVFGQSDGATSTFGTVFTDLGGVMERRIRAGFPINGGGLTISNMRLRCNTGQSTVRTGDYADPQVEMRLSDTNGQSWGEWEATSLGERGDFGGQPEWRALGQASAPGFLAEVRVTDPVDFRLSGAFINEAWGGR